MKIAHESPVELTDSYNYLEEIVNVMEQKE